VSPELELRALARRQHGVFTLAQLLECGYTRPFVRRRLAAGTWEEVVPRVYGVAATRPLDWRQHQMALTLATGGVTAGLPATAVHGLAGPPPRPEVVVVRPTRRGGDAIVHTTSELDPVDITNVDGIPVTTVSRTLIDLGTRLPRPLFEDMLDTAIVRRLVTVNRLEARARALWAPRRGGCAVVLDLLRERQPTDARSANLWEARVLRIVRRAGLPEPRVNHRIRVGGRIRHLDLAWPEAKVAVEFDGFVPHSTRRVFDDDRARQNDLVAEGWTVFRITKAMLRGDIERTFDPIAAAVLGKVPRFDT
jgi:very-short-patch-repair endonuclease